MIRVLLLVPTRTYRTGDFMAAAARLGVDVVVGSERRNALESLSGGGTLRVDLGDPERGAATIVEYARDRPLDAVVGVDDGSTLVASAAAAALDLPHNDLDAVEASRDKSVARARFAAAGLPTPHHIVVEADADPSTILSTGRVRFPCVIKPIDLSSSQGVIRADDSQSFEAAFARVAAIVRSPAVCAPGTAPQKLIVESFIPGSEVAVEGLIRGGELEILAVFDKPDPLDGPFFEETIYVTPSRLAPETLDGLEVATRAAVGALGLTEGPIHAEFRLGAGGPWVLEVAARSIGGLCARTLRFGAGLMLEELILRGAAGLELPSHDRVDTAAGVMMLPIPRAGILDEVRGMADARSVPGIDGLEITIRRGATVVPLPEGDRYLGFLFARGDTPAAVETALRVAHARLDVVVA
ncbi:MAG: ATP-grasp domain-containing protein [Chloroflexota bacterium]